MEGNLRNFKIIFTVLPVVAEFLWKKYRYLVFCLNILENIIKRYQHEALPFEVRDNWGTWTGFQIVWNGSPYKGRHNNLNLNGF